MIVFHIYCQYSDFDIIIIITILILNEDSNNNIYIPPTI